ncbi:hypothetical protein BC332_12704 [Capsicum chinense]|nr:hypothetical protein BC332_12704 [Capsicum chinense]
MVKVGSRKMGDRCLRVKVNPKVICQAPIKSLKDEALSIPIPYVRPGVFATLETKVNKPTSVNAAHEKIRPIKGKIKFTAMQGRGFPRMRSKSPVKSCSWSSPRKKLTEGFNGHQDSSQHRSPVMYKEDRVKTSPRTSFTEEAIAPQRRDSPSR